MSAMTVTCNAGGMPIGLIPMNDAVAELSREFISGERGCYALISDESRIFHSAGGLEIPAPLVIATRYTGGYADVRRENKRPSKHVLFARDHYTCQYCNFVADSKNAYKVLTVDHVKPAHLFKSRLEASYWENVTTACIPCNRRKGGHLPMEVRGKDGKPMLPKITPYKPDFVQIRFSRRLHQAQRDYINQFATHRGRRDEI
jgi:5-methylcytosine-specific restriction endonuclease McrA